MPLNDRRKRADMNGLNLSEFDRKRFDELTCPEPNSGCTLWLGGLMLSGGYGRISVNGKRHRAHCLAWLLSGQQIPNGLCVLHKCDVPSCVNPRHLFLGTQADNMRDMARKDRSHRGRLGLPRWVRRRGDRFRVSLTVNNKIIHYGTYRTIQEAETAALAISPRVAR